jgi:manganese transport protein
MRNKRSQMHAMPEELVLHPKKQYEKIAVCVDFSSTDSEAISAAIQQGGTSSKYLLIHITETAMARVMEEETDDQETEFDISALKHYKERLNAEGYSTEIVLGFGNPKMAIPKFVEEHKCDLIVMGAHGHQFLKDLFFGATIDSVRHSVRIPVLVVRKPG